jgi:hypothetical protein
MGNALVAGDVDRAIEDFRPELRRKLGEVIGLLPLPSSEAAIESVTQGGSSYVVVLRLTGESEEVPDPDALEGPRRSADGRRGKSSK